MAKDSIVPSPLEPPRSVVFDLARGEIRVTEDHAGQGDPHVLVPLSALIPLLEKDDSRDASADERAASGASSESKRRENTAGRTLGRAMGVAAMERVASRLVPRTGLRAQEAIRTQRLETIVDLLGRELALLGLGSLRVERWGRALLFVLDSCNLPHSVDALVEGLFEGSLASVAARDVRALVVDRTEQRVAASHSTQLASGTADTVRVLVGSEGAIQKVLPLVEKGQYFTDVIRSLHADESGGGV